MRIFLFSWIFCATSYVSRSIAGGYGDRNSGGGDGMVTQEDTIFVSGMDPSISEEEICQHFLTTVEFSCLVTRKEKISCCTVIVEGICSPIVRQNPKFPQVLTPAIEILLTLCNDDESDVRMIADESLNKIIRV